MDSEIKTGDLKLIREIIIELALSTFKLIMALKDEEEDTISLGNSIEKALLMDVSDTHHAESSNILTIIREIDSIHDIILSEKKISKQISDRYDDFVDTQTSKTKTDKDKRYQIAADFFSFIAINLLQMKKNQESSLDTLNAISSKLIDVERNLTLSKEANQIAKFQEIIKYTSSLEKTIGKLVKGMNIDPSEILPPEN